MNVINMVDSTRKESLLAILAKIGLPDLKILEVGSYAGASAKVFTSSPLVSKILCIDPWIPDYCKSDDASYSNFTLVERTFDTVMRESSGKIEKFKGTLDEFVSKGNNFKPNFVYIDANHEYAAVKNDINNALKLNPSYIGGHDYHRAFGVIPAVDEVFKKPDMVFNDSSWLVKLRD